MLSTILSVVLSLFPSSEGPLPKQVQINNNQIFTCAAKSNILYNVLNCEVLAIPNKNQIEFPLKNKRFDLDRLVDCAGCAPYVTDVGEGIGDPGDFDIIPFVGTGSIYGQCTCSPECEPTIDYCESTGTKLAIVLYESNQFLKLNWTNTLFAGPGTYWLDIEDYDGDCGDSREDSKTFMICKADFLDPPSNRYVFHYVVGCESCWGYCPF